LWCAFVILHHNPSKHPTNLEGKPTRNYLPVRKFNLSFAALSYFIAAMIEYWAEEEVIEKLIAPPTPAANRERIDRSAPFCTGP
jgi:hypothetical protein